MGIEPTLRRYREIERVRLPATIDGGDVVRSDRTLYVGVSPRTNVAGIDALRDVVSRYVYEVIAVPVLKCLHLKTACSVLADGHLLVNRDWIDASSLPASIANARSDRRSSIQRHAPSPPESGRRAAR